MSSSAAPASPTTIWLGLDVHKESVTIAVLRGDAQTADRVDRLPNDLPKLKRYLDRLAGQGPLRAVYEASGAGYVLHRACTAWGVPCDVIAPSLIPTKPGVQRKHDTYDAIQLARLHRAGELTVIRIPTEAEERVRDLVRCRETFQREILKSRHYLLKFLARRGCVYLKKAWTPAHYAWLRQLTGTASPLVDEDRVVFGEYLALLEYKLSRRDDLDQRIAQLALSPALAPAIARLQCFRGIDVHSAMVLATELVDWRRFTSPRQLMSYFGLVPREHSSGDLARRGAITKAGNSHVRHVAIAPRRLHEHVPKVGVGLKARQQGQSPRVLAHTWKAQHRLYKLYHRLHAKRPPQIAAVAVARELVGFLWSVMQDLDHPVPQSM